MSSEKEFLDAIVLKLLENDKSKRKGFDESKIIVSSYHPQLGEVSLEYKDVENLIKESLTTKKNEVIVVSDDEFEIVK